jgi:hypothetical protein
MMTINLEIDRESGCRVPLPRREDLDTEGQKIREPSAEMEAPFGTVVELIREAFTARSVIWKLPRTPRTHRTAPRRTG